MPQRLAENEIATQLDGLDDWAREGHYLRKEFRFDDFEGAMAFVNRVASAAQEIDHHPDIDIRYTRVRLLISTHSAGGLTGKDFELARRIDGESAR